MESRLELPEFFKQYYKTGVGAEIGTSFGYFAKQLAKWGGHVICVDTWPDQEVFHEALSLRLFPVSFLHMSSHCAASIIEDDCLDWVYIDAAHDDDSIWHDIRYWSEKVRSGGIVAGHDYLNGFHFGEPFGVKEAVDKYVAWKMLELHLIEGGNIENCDVREGVRLPSWWFVRP